MLLVVDVVVGSVDEGRWLIFSVRVKEFGGILVLGGWEWIGWKYATFYWVTVKGNYN